MKKIIEETVVIRARGQLTVPDRLREFYPWLSSNSVVTVSPISDKEIVVRPYSSEDSKKVDWKNVWEGIRLARSFRGKGGNLSQFIAKDRYSH